MVSCAERLLGVAERGCTFRHVKLALCADYCIRRLREARPSTAIAFLGTPTVARARDSHD